MCSTVLSRLFCFASEGASSGPRDERLRRTDCIHPEKVVAEIYLSLSHCMSRVACKGLSCYLPKVFCRYLPIVTSLSLTLSSVEACWTWRNWNSLPMFIRDCAAFFASPGALSREPPCTLRICWWRGSDFQSVSISLTVVTLSRLVISNVTLNQNGGWPSQFNPLRMPSWADSGEANSAFTLDLPCSHCLIACKDLLWFDHPRKRSTEPPCQEFFTKGSKSSAPVAPIQRSGGRA